MSHLERELLPWNRFIKIRFIKGRLSKEEPSDQSTFHLAETHQLPLADRGAFL